MLFSNAQASALQHRLYRVARMMLRDPWEAEDVSQESIRRLIQNLSRFHTEAEYGPWACAVAMNLCRNRARRRPVSSPDPEAPAHDAGPRPGPASTAMIHESASLAAAAVCRLRPGLRDVFILHYVEGLPYQDVADICHITAGAARVRALRAREVLRSELGRGETA